MVEPPAKIWKRPFELMAGLKKHPQLQSERSIGVVLYNIWYRSEMSLGDIAVLHYSRVTIFFQWIYMKWLYYLPTQNREKISSSSFSSICSMAYLPICSSKTFIFNQLLTLFFHKADYFFLSCLLFSTSHRIDQIFNWIPIFHWDVIAHAIYKWFHSNPHWPLFFTAAYTFY